MKKLSKNELKELKGGALIPPGGTPGIPGDKDVLNTNRVSDCTCNFNDNCVISNDNYIEGCSCVCSKD